MPASVAPRAGPGPAQASTSTSSPLRNRWQRTPPVARPLGGYSAYGVTFTVTAAVPGSAPALPATVTTTGSAGTVARVHGAEPDHRGAGGQPDPGHAARGPALRAHRRRAEPQQLRVAGDEHQVLRLVGELHRAHHPVAVLERDHLELGGVLRVVREPPA